MAVATNATPLIALDAVVIDTETTGLDPRKAFVIEIGAVRLTGGRVDEDATFRHLVRPRGPIPPQVTKIHGIDDAKVADAPGFAQVWPQLADFLGAGVVIGHTLGFDLSVLKCECERDAIAWTRPRALDTQLLAHVAEPDLAGYSLEQLANWLGVEITARHAALGDAITTARVFQALIPKLRDRGVRTVAEAITACRALSEVLDGQYRAGWLDVAQAPGRELAERAPDRFDSYPYRHRTGDVMSAPPRLIGADRTLGNALSRMIAEKSSSLFVCPAGQEGAPLPAADAGIVTERDVLRALDADGLALRRPVADFMSGPLTAVPADAFVYRAIGRMSRLRIRHLGVTDASGVVIGALSVRDLLRLRAGDAIALDDEIDEAADVHQLAKAWAKLPQVAASLLREDISACDIAAVISRELGALTRRAALLAERRMRAQGLGDPPCAYCVVVLGSAGRGESLLAMDQDNALIFAEGEPDGAIDQWFAALGAHIADTLHEVGVPYCQGGVMAKNPPWRGSVATWRERVTHWITRSSPDDLLAVDIFFDMRGVHGQTAMAEELWRYGFDLAEGNAGFAKLLAETAGTVEPAVGLFGGFKTREGRVDLKKSALFGIVTTARLLAIHHHVLERATPRRLAGIKALGLGASADLDALIDAQDVLVRLVLDQQVDDIEHGRPPTNKVAVKRLTARDREALHGALQAVRPLGDLSRDLLFGS